MIKYGKIEEIKEKLIKDRYLAYEINEVFINKFVLNNKALIICFTYSLQMWMEKYCRIIT